MKTLPNVEPIMAEALRDLPADVRCEYDLACARAPDVVAAETPKHIFLRAEDNHPWRAATRLAMYWKFRRQCMNGLSDSHDSFSDSHQHDDDEGDDDRWLRPMMLTSTSRCGKSCLGNAEIALLRRGIFRYHANETNNDPVVVVDPSRNLGFNLTASARILFYMGTVLAQDPALQAANARVTVVYAVTSGDTTSHIDARLGRYMAQGLPVRVKRFVVVQNVEPLKQGLVEYLAVRRQLQIQTCYHSPCQLIATNDDNSSSNIDINIDNNQAASSSPFSSCQRKLLLELVAQAGIPTDALPASFGGHNNNNGNDVLCDWIRQRMTMDGTAMSSACPLAQLRLQQQRQHPNDSDAPVTTQRSRPRRGANKRKRNNDKYHYQQKRRHEIMQSLSAPTKLVSVTPEPVDISATNPVPPPPPGPTTTHVVLDDLLADIRQAMKKCQTQLPKHNYNDNANNSEDKEEGTNNNKSVEQDIVPQTPDLISPCLPPVDCWLNTVLSSSAVEPDPWDQLFGYPERA